MKESYLSFEDNIFIAGARGMVGSSVARELKKNGFHNLFLPSKEELDLTEQVEVRQYFKDHSIDVVVIAAAKVGGIGANMTYPADFIYQNLLIETLLIHEAYKAGVRRLLFLGSSCIYPKFAPQPLQEESLLTGALESTNEAYAVAKIAGVKMCYYYHKQYGAQFISAMPTNLYGPGDRYHPEDSHVIPALIHRFHEAKEKEAESVTIWGSGKPLREFLYVEDLARAIVLLLEQYNDPLHINIGSSDEISIGELAQLIKEVVGYKGNITFDLTKPDGTPRKKCATHRIEALGWRPITPLREGLAKAYNHFVKNNFLFSF